MINFVTTYSFGHGPCLENNQYHAHNCEITSESLGKFNYCKFVEQREEITLKKT